MPTFDLYLAGPMSGLPDYNLPAFISAAAKLRAAGFSVQNPAENPPPNASPSWEDWMRLALAQLVQCRGIALLPGWQESKGARLEHQVACSLNMAVFLLD